jgi:phospholipid/cholesterol/gamma-HCH transport system ATP-binding protein
MERLSEMRDNAQQTSETPMILVKEIWKSYGSLQVLKGLSLKVFRGETVVILGRSGVGKSVLLKQIIGIEQPDRGEIRINDLPMSTFKERKEHAGKLRMGMLFQGSALFDSMNVGENTAFYLNQHDKELTAKEVKERVAKALELVAMEGTESKMPSELSGGMRKRAALARLVVYRPSILLYDEPTTGLDPVTAMQINKLINETRHQLHGTGIVVTHDVRSAMEVADRVAFHHDGQIIYIAPKEEFFKTDNPLILSFLANATIRKEE